METECGTRNAVMTQQKGLFLTWRLSPSKMGRKEEKTGILFNGELEEVFCPWKVEFLLDILVCFF